VYDAPSQEHKGSNPMTNGWSELTPTVSIEAEFWEIANDFGDPLELLREAISNSVDAGASWIRINFFVEEIEGAKSLVIEIEDDGCGMTYDVLSQDFWGLGFSQSRLDKGKIGEKGHGTKIYLRSDRVSVRTQSAGDANESVCENPMKALATRQCHHPRIRPIAKYQDHTGTFIRIEGYNKSERARFKQDAVRDYLLWFTKIGSVEKVFGIDRLANLKVFLRCLDVEEFEEVPFGHRFATEASNIHKLFDVFGLDAAEWFAKPFVWKERLEQLPEITYEAVIYVEGDRAKRSYNPMIRERIHGKSGKYRVSDRYGLWLCKDYIPIQRVNEWISGFGTGSNSFVLLHGFINCQTLKLTANRGSIANTDPKVVSELEKTIQRLVGEIDKDLNKNGLYTLLQWQTESRTLEQEKAEFDRRTKTVEQRKLVRVDGRVLLEPQNESELFGLLIAIYSMHPEIFDFEPLDYNTTRGIDIIARNKKLGRVADSKFWYVELKYLLKDNFNHAFKNLRWIVCWDFDKTVGEDTEFKSIEETDIRQLKKHKDAGHTSYFLDNPSKANKIQVLRLNQFLKEKLSLEFQTEAVSHD
jgi:hypothetical protein